MPRAFEPVSSHSVLGSESATMPAPTWIEARRPWHTTVRMVMQESRLPGVRDVADRAAVGAAPGRLQLLDDLHRPDLGRPATACPAGKQAASTSKASLPGVELCRARG